MQNFRNRLDFPKALRGWLQAMGYSVRQAHIKSGVALRTLHFILAGELQPTLPIIERLYRLSGLDLYELALCDDDVSRLPQGLQRVHRELHDEWHSLVAKMATERGRIPSGNW